MKTLSISEAKRSLEKVADAALQGQPALITRKSKLLILQEFPLPEPIPQPPPGYFNDCYAPDEIEEVNFLATQGSISVKP